MKKLLELIKKLLGMSGSSDSSSSSDSSEKGFTLIELLIVIAVIGILAAALLISIDPIDKIRAGNDTKVINDVRAIHDGATRVYTQTNAWPVSIDDIRVKDELKSTPVQPTGYLIYNYVLNTAGDDWVVWGEIKSKTNKNKIPGSPSGTDYFLVTGGKGCFVDAVPVAGTVCP